MAIVDSVRVLVRVKVVDSIPDQVSITACRVRGLVGARVRVMVKVMIRDMVRIKVKAIFRVSVTSRGY